MNEVDKNNNSNIKSENNNNQNMQSQSESVKDNVKETVDNVKTGASLATNAAAGNYVGAAKDAIKLLSNKKNRKRMIVHAVINFLSPFIIILIAGACLLGIFEAVGDAVGGFLAGVVDFFTIDSSDGSIDIEDEDVDEIINTIYELGVNPADLKLLGDLEDGADVDSPEYKKALRKYVRKFYEAQLVTETLNYYHNESTDNETFGAIFPYRATSQNAEENRKELTYVPYETMLEYDETDNIKALDHFSINETTGQLVVAGTVQVKMEGGPSKESLNEINNATTINLVNIDYKSAVAQYTTKFEVLLYLTMISQNPEFVAAVTELIKDSRIELTIMDNVSTNVVTNTYDYIQWTRTAEEYTNEDGTTSTFYRETAVPGTEVSRITTITTTPSAYITYAKTWFCEQEIKYERVTDPTITDAPITNGPWSEDPPPEGQEGSWKTDQTELIESETTNTTYRESYREAVKLIVGERGDRDRYANGQIPEPTFVGLMETEFDIPNSTRTAEAGTNLVSGAEMLFFLLQQDPKLENMEMIMRYALNKYTDTEDYGKNFDVLLDSLEANMLLVGTDYVVNTARSGDSIVVTDAATLRKAIETLYEGDTKTNLINEIPSFLAMQEQYGVNAVFAMAVTIIESNGGTSWAAIAPFTHNWMSVTGSYNGQTYRNPNSSNPLTWRVYPSFREATLDFGNLIANSSYYFKAGKYSVDLIAPTYCNSYWGSKVSAEMTKIFNAAGIQIPTDDSGATGSIGSGSSGSSGSIDSGSSGSGSTGSGSGGISGITVGGITSDSEAASLQSYIENELLNTRVHSNGEYQNGPFAQWWSYPYNVLDPFQCTWWANGRASMYLEKTYGARKKISYTISEMVETIIT